MNVTKSKLRIFDDISNYTSSQIFEEYFDKLFKVLGLSNVLKQAKLVKQRGYNIVTLIWQLCQFCISRQTVGMASKSKTTADENTYYSLLNKANVDWRLILQQICINLFKSLNDNNLNESKVPTFLVFDDTLIAKTGKTMEGVSMVFDHTTHQFQLGYKMLLCGIVDGRSFVPLDFSLHREAHKDGSYGLRPEELQRQYKTICKSNSCEAKRIEELDMSKTDEMLEMTKSAIEEKDLHVDYVLIDSWYATPKVLEKLSQMKLHCIGMAKMDKTLYCTNDGTKMTLANILKNNHLQPHRTRIDNKYKCIYFCKTAEVKGVKVKLFFVKLGKQSGWKVLITTDLSLSFEECFKYYQMRWSVEVCFRNCKQNTNLTRCQSTSLVAQIASMTIALMTYSMVTYLQRMREHDTIGEMFRQLWAEQLEHAIWGECQRMVRLLVEIVNMPIFETVYDLLAADRENLADKLQEMVQLLRLHTDRQAVRFD